MVFGNAEFMRYPWETIVKLYRQSKADRSEPKVAAWGRDFLRYLSRFGKIRDEDKSDNPQKIIGSVFDELQDEVFADARRKSVSIPSMDYVNLLSTRVQQEIIRLQRRDDYFDETQKKDFITKYAVDISEVVDVHFQAFADADLISKARELALLAVFKREFSPQSCGFVIAGFGADEYFPALVAYETDGYVGD